MSRIICLTDQRELRDLRIEVEQLRRDLLDAANEQVALSRHLGGDWLAALETAERLLQARSASLSRHGEPGELLITDLDLRSVRRCIQLLHTALPVHEDVMQSLRRSLLRRLLAEADAVSPAHSLRPAFERDAPGLLAEILD